MVNLSLVWSRVSEIVFLCPVRSNAAVFGIQIIPEISCQKAKYHEITDIENTTLREHCDTYRF